MTDTPEPRQKRSNRRELTWPEFRAFRDQLANVHARYPVAASLMWYCGLRLSETLQIHAPDIKDLHTLNPTLALRAETTKNRQARTIPIPSPLARRLIHWLAETAPFFESDPPLEGYPGPILLRKHVDDQPRTPHVTLTPRAVQYAFTIAARKASIAHTTPHTLRHTFAKRMLKVADLRTVQTALGHKSVLTTQTYTEPTLDDVRLAMLRAFTEEL